MKLVWTDLREYQGIAQVVVYAQAVVARHAFEQETAALGDGGAAGVLASQRISTRFACRCVKANAVMALTASVTKPRPANFVRTQ